MTYILGLNAYHADAAACLVKDGTLVAAVEEERFRRVKHWGGFPGESIRYCLAEAGVSLADVDHVAINSDNRANRWRKLAYVLTSGVSPGYVLSRLRQRGDQDDSPRDPVRRDRPVGGVKKRFEPIPTDEGSHERRSAYLVEPATPPGRRH